MKIDEAAAPRTSHRLMLLAEHPADRVSLGDAMTVLGGRGFGLLLLILTLPNAVPIPAPPGVSLALALPLILVAAQMAIGFDQPRLPERLRRLSMSRARPASVLGRALPHLQRIERHLQPRHPGLTGPHAERLLGAACLVLALVLCLPIPMGNVPVAWALVVVALGLLERDGLFALIGLAAGLLAVGWNVVLVLVGGTAVAAAAETIAMVLPTG